MKDSYRKANDTEFCYRVACFFPETKQKSSQFHNCFRSKINNAIRQPENILTVFLVPSWQDELRHMSA